MGEGEYSEHIYVRRELALSRLTPIGERPTERQATKENGREGGRGLSTTTRTMTSMSKESERKK
jgi:hypothetical protein